MDILDSTTKIEELIQNPIKQLLEGAVGFLKMVDPTHQAVIYGICIIINENTVLTLAQYVYDSSTSSFFP